MKDFMKKNHFFTYSKMCVLALTGASALFLASCAKDGYDDESFDSGVNNTQVSSIAVDDITITPSADGKTQTISWPVVMGAGGYRVSLIDVSNPDEPIIGDSLVDGCSVTAKREEDVNYKLTILTLGNKSKNNTDSSEPVLKDFSTFTPTYKTIPAGSNLNEWFAANPLPADKVGENLNFDLVGGAEYTVSGLLDFGANSVTLRSNSKSDWASITFTDVASEFSTSAGFVLKYLDIDCSASKAAFLSLSRTPAITPVVVNAWGADYNFYRVKDNISILNCDITGVNSYFLWDNQVSVWYADNVLVDNCLVHLTTPKDSKAISGGYFWTNKGAGFFRNLTVNNSTFYNTGEGDVKYFVQYGGFGNDQVNYNGTAGKKTSYWNMKNCIFYNCSTSGVARRFLAGKQNQATAVFENNTYMKADGTFDNPSNYDNSGTDIKEDPQFADPANGDFTISGATQVARKTGDPRWLP